MQAISSISNSGSMVSMRHRLFIMIDTAAIGGPGKGILQFLKHLHERDQLDCCLCTFEYKHQRTREFIDAAVESGVTLRVIQARSSYDLEIFRGALREARRWNATIIQSHGYKTHLIGSLIARRMRRPWVAFAHGWTAENLKVRLFHALDRVLLRRSDLVVVVSPPLYQALSVLRPDDPTELVLNAVDPDEIQGDGTDLRHELSIDNRTILLGTIGRLSHEKGQLLLLEALSLLRQHEPSVKARLVIIGDGSERHRLMREISIRGLTSVVSLLPHRRALRGCFEALDLLVIPSLSEGLSNVMLEAMSLGRPVLSTRTGAAAEVIRSGETGWLVDPGSARALASGLSEALADRARLVQVGEAGQRSLFPRFAPRERVERIVKLYQQLGL